MRRKPTVNDNYNFFKSPAKNYAHATGFKIIFVIRKIILLIYSQIQIIF